MEELGREIAEAKRDKKAAGELIEHYMPFIKKQAAAFEIPFIEYEDRLSIAMLAFLTSIRQYSDEKGGFLALAALNIRNRIIDEYRRQARYQKKLLPLYSEEEHEVEERLSNMARIRYDREEERQMLAEEIEEYTKELKQHEISFAALLSVCPKQERARKQCMAAAWAARNNEKHMEHFKKTGRLPNKELALELGISVKTIEKHRQYIIAILILLAGDFPAIATYLPEGKEGARR